MATTDYHFIDRWRVRGTVKEVADILSDAPGLARWWPSTYLSVTRTKPGDEDGIGEEGAVHAKGWLPYTIRFNYRVTGSNYPNGFTLEAKGDLTGRGIWTFVQDGEWVNITYEWIIRTDKPLLRRLSFLLKPIFRSNHNWTMRQGERSLALELARRRARSEAERRTIPPPPGPVSNTPWYVAGALALGGLYWLATRTTTLRISYSTVVARPVAQVFAYLADVTNEPNFTPDIQSVTLTSSTPGPFPIAVGSTFREVRRSLGRTLVWEMRVTEFVPNRRYCIESTGGAFPYRGCRVFTAEGNRTRITEYGEMKIPLYYAPVKGILTGLARKAVADAYERLKAILER